MQSLLNGICDRFSFPSAALNSGQIHLESKRVGVLARRQGVLAFWIRSGNIGRRKDGKNFV